MHATPAMLHTPSVSRQLLLPLTAIAVALALAAGIGGCVEEQPPPRNIAGAGGTRDGGSGGAGGFGGFGAFGGFDAGGFGGFGATPTPTPPPPGSFLAQPAVSAGAAPPALSGGTLLVLADGQTAFAADPDRDQLYFADLRQETLLATVPLQAGDEPGRAVEDAQGGVHVVLRGGGAVVSLARDRSVRERRAVCGAPRGIAHDRPTSALHVVCAGGELVTLPAAGGPVVRAFQLDRDLRDVVVSGEQLLVSRFRSGEVLVVSAASGEILERRPLPGSAPARRLIMSASGPLPAATPGVAWRMKTLLDGSAAVLHQEATNGELGVQSGGYGGGPCRSPVAAALTHFGARPGSAVTGAQLGMAGLPVDFAESRDGRRRAIVLAGNGRHSGAGGAPAVHYARGSGAGGAGGASEAPPPAADCMFPQPQPPDPETIEFRQPVGDAIAVDFDGQGRVVVQTREPARLEIVSHRGGTIKLADDSRFDSGHALFHSATRNGLACASCHPEGGDDGRVWHFAGIGPRRTQNLRGGIAASAPFHWDGDMRDLRHLMTEVFSTRMGGSLVADDHVQALAGWLDRLPAATAGPAGDAAASERGRALFNDAAVACATCHGGPRFSNNATMDVGTGKPFQVPSLLGVGSRAPYMHDGCAPTLKLRFRSTDACSGGDKHGKTRHLTDPQLNDLIAFLESL
jgi:hypothetical protein